MKRRTLIGAIGISPVALAGCLDRLNDDGDDAASSGSDSERGAAEPLSVTKEPDEDFPDDDDLQKHRCLRYGASAVYDEIEAALDEPLEGISASRYWDDVRVTLQTFRSTHDDQEFVDEPSHELDDVVPVAPTSVSVTVEDEDLECGGDVIVRHTTAEPL